VVLVVVFMVGLLSGVRGQERAAAKAA